MIPGVAILSRVWGRKGSDAYDNDNWAHQSAVARGDCLAPHWQTRFANKLIRPGRPALPLEAEAIWNSQAAAFLRFAANRSSTSATWASIAGCLMPFCLAIACTSLSARSILGAPFCRARAAEAGRVRLCAAAAYFSNGTRSAGDAPSLTQRSNTKL